MQLSKRLLNKSIETKINNIFINSIKSIKTPDKAAMFLRDLLSPSERSMLAKRIAIAFMLLEDKYTYEEIIRTLKVSNGTVAKVQTTLISQGKGYKEVVGNLVTKKVIKNSLAEVLDQITPKKRTLTGETYKKPFIQRRLKRDNPL